MRLCFSGKDPSKVDRSGAYKAHEIAIHYLKERNLARCEVQLSYTIGIAEPLAIYILGDGKNIAPEKSLYTECTPKQMIEDLALLDKCFEETAKLAIFRYSHRQPCYNNHIHYINNSCHKEGFHAKPITKST